MRLVVQRLMKRVGWVYLMVCPDWWSKAVGKPRPTLSESWLAKVAGWP